MDPVTDIAEEWIDEVMGTSSKRWALVLVAFVAGALGALWLVRRARSTGPVTDPVESGPD